jgi:hypothetical protein
MDAFATSDRRSRPSAMARAAMARPMIARPVIARPACHDDSPIHSVGRRTG